MIDLRCCDNLELMAEIKDNTIDLIYCDILYGTGRKFKDYQDLKPKREIIKEHYIPRIKEMHRILKDTGSIYLQMDTRINHWLRIIMDDIFGYDNFLNEISWCYGAGNSSKKSFSKKHDVILFYSKTNKYIFDFESIKKNNIRIKDYWHIQSIADKSGYLQIDNEYRLYETQKPKALLERIIKASSNKGDLVADFYAGSFTTAEVCKDLNRHFIGCDISQKAYEIGLKRLKEKRKEQPTLFNKLN